TVRGPRPEIVPGVAGRALEVLAGIGQRIRERSRSAWDNRIKRVKAPRLVAHMAVAGGCNHDAQRIVAHLTHLPRGIGEAPWRKLVIVDDAYCAVAEWIGQLDDREGIGVVREPGDRTVAALERRALRELRRGREVVHFVDLPPQTVALDVAEGDKPC